MAPTMASTTAVSPANKRDFKKLLLNWGGGLRGTKCYWVRRTIVAPLASTGPSVKPSARETYLMKLPMMPRQLPSQATAAVTVGVVFWKVSGSVLLPLNFQPLTLNAANVVRP